MPKPYQKYIKLDVDTSQKLTDGNVSIVGYETSCNVNKAGVEACEITHTIAKVGDKTFRLPGQRTPSQVKTIFARRVKCNCIQDVTLKY